VLEISPVRPKKPGQARCADAIGAATPMTSAATTTMVSEQELNIRRDGGFE
jgi:hypothetical protein